MAVTKNISYVGPSGTMYTGTITIDVQKSSVGTESDEEQVYLVISNGAIPASGHWRRNIDALVEDGIFASPSGTDHVCRYVAPSGDYSAYGDKFDNSEEGFVAGESGIYGIRHQLIGRATA